MKTLLKILLILILIGGLTAGGIYGYSRYTLSQPVKVQPVGNWLLEYAPNQTYMGGSVTSGTSFLLYGEQNRTPLEIFVSEGDTVRVGDPLVRYDTTKDLIDLDEKLLQRQKLYDDLEALYKEYKRYSFEEYERTVPTATPSPTPTPRGYAGVSAQKGTELGIVRLSAPVRRALQPQSGDGSQESPYRFTLASGDPIPEALLTALQKQAMQQTVYAWFKTDIGLLCLRFTPSNGGSMQLTAMLTEAQPTGALDADSLRPTAGDGSLKNPYIFPYTEGIEVPGDFFARYCRRASAEGKYLYTELQGRKLTVAVDFTSMGNCILRMKLTPEPTPTPEQETPAPAVAESAGGSGLTYGLIAAAVLAVGLILAIAIIQLRRRGK